MRKLLALGLILLLSGLACLHQNAWSQGIPLTGAGGKFKSYNIPPYTANAVSFDGASDYLTRGADLTGSTDSDKFSLSVWVKHPLISATLNSFFTSATPNNFDVNFGTAGTNRIYVQNSADNQATTNYEIRTANRGGDTDTWVNFLISVDMTISPKTRLYANGTSDLVVQAGPTGTPFTIDMTSTNWAVAATVAGATKYTGCFAELWFAQGVAIDFSVQANREKFRSAAGKPVDLGSDGSLPTGSQPIVYLKNAAASVGTNSGSGGNFTINGAPAACSTSPSD